MFPYDPQLAANLQNMPQTIDGVLALMQTIDGICQPTDGLKWFNWLYMAVTRAVRDKAAAGAFQNGAWLSDLDVRFAAFYFRALGAALAGSACPACWDAMLKVRNQAAIARIQFALAGMNAHINHDLPMAIVAACQGTSVAPRHGTGQYSDYTAVNPILDAITEAAKKALNVRLPGDALPDVSHVEGMVANWSLAEFREKAWNTAQSLWAEPEFARTARMDVIDTLVGGINTLLLAPEP